MNTDQRKFILHLNMHCIHFIPNKSFMNILHGYKLVRLPYLNDMNFRLILQIFLVEILFERIFLTLHCNAVTSKCILVIRYSKRIGVHVKSMWSMLRLQDILALILVWQLGRRETLCSSNIYCNTVYGI